MAEIREFWLAKGACAQCGSPVAKRAQEPGAIDVPCNRCHTSTHLAAVRMLQEDGRPPVPAPLSSSPVLPAASPTPPPPAAPRARRSLWVALAGFAAVLALVGVAAWAVLSPGAPVAWTSLNETLVPEFGEDEVRFHVEYTARDAQGAILPKDLVTDVGDWYFAHTPTRAETPKDLMWTTCNPTNCTYAVPAGSVLYYNSFSPHASGTGAFDTATRTLATWSIDEWRPVPDWEAQFSSFMTVRMQATPPGMREEWRIIVFSNASNSDQMELNVSILQGGNVVQSDVITASSPFGESWKTPEFGASVKKGPAEVRVTDGSGALVASRMVIPSSCDRLETRIYVAVSETGKVTLDEVICI